MKDHRLINAVVARRKDNADGKKIKELLLRFTDMVSLKYHLTQMSGKRNGEEVQHYLENYVKGNNEGMIVC